MNCIKIGYDFEDKLLNIWIFIVIWIKYSFDEEIRFDGVVYCCFDYDGY